VRLGFFIAMAGRRAGGPETYEVSLIRELVALGGGHEYHVFCAHAESARALGLDRPDVRCHLLRPRFRPVSYLVSLPASILRTAPDLVHATFIPPVVAPVPYVLTVHDAGMFEHPEFYDFRRGALLRALIGRGIQRARLLICPTEATREVIAGKFRVPAGRLAVIPHGVSPRFRPVDPGEMGQRLRRYETGGRYVLFPGKLIRNKNVLRVMEAFARFRRAAGEPVNLVISGRRAWRLDGLDETIARHGLAPFVRELGYIDEDDMPALYAGAEMVVFPSLYEGFGLPVIEAMACGTPVVTSNIPVLREVSGGAALTADPYSAEAIADAMTRVWSEPALRADLVARGLERASRFSWRRTAEATLAAYAAALDDRAGAPGG
jgi:glycosyltransferase involved in cell wall biosynthesis